MKTLTVASLMLAASSMIFTSVGLLAQEAAEPPPVLVEVDSVNAENVARQIWVPGTVQSKTDSDISAEVAGRITWMADVGDLVEAGDVLAKLDDQMLQLNLLQNQSNIIRWEARVALLTSKRKRFSTMAMQNNTSKDQLDEIIAELAIAKQELAQAKIQSKQTEFQISQSEVKAPFKSLVVERRQTPGEYSAVGQGLMRIVDTSNIEASIKAPLSAVPFIHQGMEVQVKSGVKVMSEVIRTIVPVGNSQSRMMEVRVALNSGDFPIGSAVRVALPHSQYHQANTVPRDALVLRKSGAFIYQIDKDNLAQQVMIETGIGVGDRIEIIGPVLADSPVVVRGAERLRPGQKVRFEQSTNQVALLN
jgi:RND family efflux transporter MFP subunit